MKKIIILIISTILLCGCEVTYNIDIDDDYYESTRISPTYQDELAEIKQESKDLSPIDNENDFNEPDGDGIVEDVVSKHKYKREIDSYINYSYKFYNQYHLSTMGNEGSGKFIVVYSDPSDNKSNIYANNFTNVFDAYDKLDKITVNITTKKEVTYHNADVVNGATYTWVITRLNPNREINIYFMSDTIYDEDTESSLVINPEYRESNSNNDKENKSNNNSNKNNNGQPKSLKIYLLIPLSFAAIFAIIKFRDRYSR